MRRTDNALALAREEWTEPVPRPGLGFLRSNADVSEQCLEAEGLLRAELLERDGNLTQLLSQRREVFSKRCNDGAPLPFRMGVQDASDDHRELGPFKIRFFLQAATQLERQAHRDGRGQTGF